MPTGGPGGAVRERVTRGGERAEYWRARWARGEAGWASGANWADEGVGRAWGQGKGGRPLLGWFLGFGLGWVFYFSFLFLFTPSNQNLIQTKLFEFKQNLNSTPMHSNKIKPCTSMNATKI